VLDPADGAATLDELAERRGMTGAPPAAAGQLGFDLGATEETAAGLVEATDRLHAAAGHEIIERLWRHAPRRRTS